MQAVLDRVGGVPQGTRGKSGRIGRLNAGHGEQENGGGRVGPREREPILQPSMLGQGVKCAGAQPLKPQGPTPLVDSEEEGVVERTEQELSASIETHAERKYKQQITHRDKNTWRGGENNQKLQNLSCREMR